MKSFGFISALIVTLAVSAPVFAGQGHEHPTGDHHSATAFDTITKHYEAIYESLVTDSIEGIPTHAKAIATASQSVSEKFSARTAGVSEANADQCRKILPEISSAATALAAAKDISSARDAFGDLSVPLVEYREMINGEKPKVAFCPMVKKPWLQEGSEIGNPYFGSSMLGCGSIVSE